MNADLNYRIAVMYIRILLDLFTNHNVLDRIE